MLSNEGSGTDTPFQKDNIDDPQFEIVSIEVAARVLQLLLASSSQTVATAVDRVADVKIARTVGWGAGTVLNTGLAIASTMLLPLAAPLAVYSGFQTIKSGVDLAATRRHCRDGK